MVTTSGSGSAAEQEAVDVRGGAGEIAAGAADPVSLLRSLGKGILGARRHPVPAARVLGTFAGDLARTAVSTAQRAVGVDAAAPLQTGPKDKRFADPAWSENPAYFALLQAHLASRRLLTGLVEAAQLEEPTASKAAFTAELVADALAPTNFFVTNPTAIKRAFDTGGKSAVRGLRNFAHDVRTNQGYPSQVDTSPFELGRNMAATPGKVVFRNDLIELIQYHPTTEQVHEIPMLVCPPWINKYYITDLAPGKSLVKWAVDHGHTVFVISYRNADSSMRDVGFDDYLLQGPRTAVDVVREITGSDTVNTLAICLGGTLNTCLLAYLDAVGERGIVNTSTYINCLNDHGIGGTLGSVFADAATVDTLSRKMQKKGYLDAKDMARTFDFLRANDLIFNYVVNNWLLGEQPAAFDLLTWNNDSTRMPAKMHTFYLRKCWVENALARDEMELAGHRLKVTEIATETYIVAAVDDHIVPWQGSYRTTQLFKGESRFVLSSAGHIAGIVNPPSPKSRLWTNDDLPVDPLEWRAGATEHHDTWWNDWATWMDEHAGSMRPAPEIGNDRYPALYDAPGEYVRS